MEENQNNPPLTRGMLLGLYRALSHTTLCNGLTNRCE